MKKYLFWVSVALLVACGNPVETPTNTPVVAPAGWPQYAESYPLTYTGVVSLDTTQCYSFSLLTCTWTIGVPYEGASFVMPEGSHGLGVPLRLLVHDAFDTDASSKPSGSEVYFYDVDSTLWKVAIEAVWTNAPTTFDSEMRVWVPTLYE